MVEALHAQVSVIVAVMLASHQGLTVRVHWHSGSQKATPVHIAPMVKLIKTTVVLVATDNTKGNKQAVRRLPLSQVL